MKGNNTLRINQVTMQEAINLWLASQFKNPPTAKKVTSTQMSNSSEFQIELESPEDEAKDGAGK